MKDSDSRPAAPPIPPRRLKRKSRPITVGQTDGVPDGATNSVIRLEPRPRLPPPPPPQRAGLQRRGIPPQILPRKEVARISSPGNCSTEKCQSQLINGDKLLVSDMEEVQPTATLSTFGTNVPLRLPMARGNGKKPMAEDPPRRKREKGKIHRPNEYPPLFFTLQDFQDVMSDVDNSSSRTLKNMTTFEPTPRPRISRISGDDQLPVTPEKGEVLFRVTTTNLPFEKSTSEWGDVRDDPNHFIFEDYVDRRQIPAQSKARSSNTKLVLFGDDTFDRDDEEQTTTTSHTASRVRFLVDSSTRDLCGEKTELDSLQNIDSLPLDFTPVQDLMLEDKTSGEKGEGEFGEVPFDSLLSFADDNPSSLGVDPSEDSTSSKTDFQTILVTAMIEPVPSVEKVGEFFGKGDKVRDSNAGSLEDKSESLLAEEETLKVENTPGETKSPCFETQVSEVEGKCDTEENPVPEISDERDKGVENIERRKILVDESLGDLMAVDNQEDKYPGENLRRNSFLMNMLQGDDERLDERVVCKVVATHPKTPIHGSRIVGVGSGGDPSAAVEAKSKLLGELSSSFSAIRLKPVNNGGEYEEKQSASDLKVGGELDVVVEAKNLDEDNVEAENDRRNILNRNLDSVLDSNVVKCKVNEEPIEELRKPRNEPQYRSEVCSQKTDDIIDKIYLENDGGSCEKMSEIDFVGDNETKIDELITKMSYVQKESNNNNDDDHGNVTVNVTRNNNNNIKIVEIASRSSVDKCAIVLKCNNNNDNNAMTPVDVSYDQSQNNVSIIPGSVRSFVQFYEIQGETSVGLNSNDCTVATAVPKIKVEATGHIADDNYPREMSQRSIDPRSTAGVEIENDIKYTIVARKPVLQKQCNTVPVDQMMIPNQRSDKSDKQTGLFNTDHEKQSNVENEQERRREPRSRSSASEKIDAAVNMGSGIAPGMQDGSRSGVTKDVVRSGTTNHSVPKSSTSTISERYTFYCTV